MEKIQEAIAKARALREHDGPDQMPAEAAAAPETGTRVYAAPQGSIVRPAATSAPAVAPIPAPVAAAPEAAPGATSGAASRLSAAERSARWQAIPEFIPGASVLRRNRIVAVTGGKGAADFDGIRTRILQLQRANGWRRIAITSPGPGCGKSTLALNLGYSLARQADQHIIVAEMDLRRPSLASMLGSRLKHDFAAVLGGSARLADNAFRAAPNLIIATNSGPTSNSAELLQGQGTAAALEAIEAEYEPTTIIFDLPPMLAVDDTTGFLPRVDAVILVAAAEQTSIKQIDMCEREIAGQTNMMGVVLNKCRYMDRDQSYDYGY